MFNFEKELENFVPLLEVEQIEHSISHSEMKDIIELISEMMLEER